MPTQKEIIDLKSNWQADPCWDIEDTEGFEDHKDELYRFRLKKENEWANKHKQEMQKKASRYGCSDNLELARFIEILEGRIEKLEDDLRSFVYS